MRACLLLALTGCLVIDEGPVVVSRGEIIAIAASDDGLVWAAQLPGEPVHVWVLERGSLTYKLGTLAAIDQIALVRNDVYSSHGPELQIVGAQGTFLVTRAAGRLDAFDPGVTAVDHDAWRRSYPAEDATAVGVGAGRLAIGTAHLVSTFELGGDRRDVHDLAGHVPTGVLPIQGGLAFAADEGLFAARGGQLERLADAGRWAHMVELDGALWAATEPDDGRSQLVEVAAGALTTHEPAGAIIALAVGGGRVYYATAHEIYRADRANR